MTFILVLIMDLYFSGRENVGTKKRMTTKIKIRTRTLKRGTTETRDETAETTEIKSGTIKTKKTTTGETRGKTRTKRIFLRRKKRGSKKSGNLSGKRRRNARNAKRNAFASARRSDRKGGKKNGNASNRKWNARRKTLQKRQKLCLKKTRPQKMTRFRQQQLRQSLKSLPPSPSATRTGARRSA